MAFELNEFIETLAQEGWAETQEFVPFTVAKSLKDEAENLFASGQFHRAGVGARADALLRDEIRRDSIFWLQENSEQFPLQSDFLNRLKNLIGAINASLFLSIQDVEAHFAVYPPGGFYRRHVDRFRSDDRRVLSVVFYLNDGWAPEDGGLLKLYPEGREITIEPLMGKMICFLSDQIEHEVIPSHKDRWSVAAWFKRSGTRLPGL